MDITFLEVKINEHHFFQTFSVTTILFLPDVFNENRLLFIFQIMSYVIIDVLWLFWTFVIFFHEVSSTVGVLPDKCDWKLCDFISNNLVYSNFCFKSLISLHFYNVWCILLSLTDHSQRVHSIQQPGNSVTVHGCHSYEEKVSVKGHWTIFWYGRYTH